MMVLGVMTMNWTLDGPGWLGVVVLNADHCGYLLIYPSIVKTNLWSYSKSITVGTWGTITPYVLSEIISKVLVLFIYHFVQSYKSTQSLTSNLMSWGCHGGINCPTVVLTTINAKGVDTIKKHDIYVAEGRDIRAPISGTPIGSYRRSDSQLIDS